MKTRILYCCVACIVVLSAFTSAFLVGWQVKEDEYAIRFDTRGASGTIKGLKGTIDFDKGDPAKSRMDVSVDVNTINTGLGLKNRHAKAEGFFDVERYPTIHFVSNEISAAADGFLAKGRLTIKGVSQDVTIPFTFEDSGKDGVFRGNFELNRKDYNLERSLVGEIVKVELVVPVSMK